MTMSLEQQIQADMKQAMKGGEKDTVLSLRTLLAKIKDERIRLRTTRELTEDDVMAVLLMMLKRHKESVEMYQQGERPDLVKKEQAEINLLQKYLPQPLSEEEVAEIVKQVIKEVGAESIKDLGRVMGPAMGRLKGKADGKLVQNLVRQLLSS